MPAPAPTHTAIDAGDLSSAVASGTPKSVRAENFEVVILASNRVRLSFRHGARASSPRDERRPTTVSFDDPAEAFRVGQALIAAAFRAERRWANRNGARLGQPAG